MIAKSLSVWALNILCHQKGRTFGIEASEQLQRSGIKLIGPPLALYCNRSAAAAGDDEVHFIAALVPPIVNLAGLEAAMHLVQNKMFPQYPHIIGTQAVPTPEAANKAGIEPIDLRRSHNLRRFVTVERPDDMSHKSRLKRGQIVADGGPADFTGASVFSGFENAPAVDQQKFQQPLERMTTLKTKKLQDILGPIAVNPFLILHLGRAVIQKKRRQSAVEHAAFQCAVTEIDSIGGNHRCQPEVGLAPRQGITELG